MLYCVFGGGEGEGVKEVQLGNMTGKSMAGGTTCVERSM